MYLYARKYISGIDYGKDLNGQFLMTPNRELDTIISTIGLTRDDLDQDTPAVIIGVKVLQWRKANQIHEWFVQNIQDGEDNCKDYYVSRESLRELLDTLSNLIKAKQDGADESTFEDILPTQSGFFFGGTEYDEYYWSEVERTYEAINALLKNPKFEDFDFEYSSSW